MNILLYHQQQGYLSTICINNKIIIMAFVSMSQRKLPDIPENEQFPSPAHYTIKSPQVSRECAPFRTTSIRKVPLIQGSSNQLPGPGQYNIAKPIIQPKITAYTNEDSIIIKVNSTGTSQFKSDTKRFQYQNKHMSLQYDQPPKYFSIPRQRKVLPRNPINRSHIPVIKPTKPSIPTKIRALLNPENHQIVKLTNAEPGPGDYEVRMRQKIISKGTIWGKDKIKRFRDQAFDNTGPGAYNVAIDRTNHGSEKSSNFNSGTVRTFFDTIMYNSSSEYIADRRKLHNFKSPAPAPGQYNILDSSFANQEVKPQKFQFFGSSVKRFANEQIDQKGIKNTFYIAPNFVESNKSHNKLNPSFNSSSERLPVFLSVGQQVNTPGPGQYKQHIEPIKAKTGKRVQKFGSTTQRIPVETKESIDQDQQRNNENEIQLENELLKSRFGQLQTQSSIFKSKTNRICFSQAKNISLGLNYDLTYNDVSKKAQRQRIHLQNLRRIQVYKPPFQVNTPRFPHYQQWNKLQEQEKVKTEFKVVKDNSVNKVIAVGGIMDKSQRFRSQRKGAGIPGVGNYEYNNGWKNNSFNKMFQNQ